MFPIVCTIITNYFRKEDG